MHRKASNKLPRTQSWGPTAEMSNEESSQGISEVVITLLGRLVFPPDQLAKMVMKGKRTPAQYIKAYNLCDGNHGVTKIAKEIGVSIGTLSPILAEWKDTGIVYEVTKPGGTFYKRLYKLDAPKGIKVMSEEAKTEEPAGEKPDSSSQQMPEQNP